MAIVYRCAYPSDDTPAGTCEKPARVLNIYQRRNDSRLENHDYYLCASHVVDVRQQSENVHYVVDLYLPLWQPADATPEQERCVFYLCMALCLLRR